MPADPLLENRGIVSIPLSFHSAWGREPPPTEPRAQARYGTLRLRALAGVGAEERPADARTRTGPFS